ncbi:MAG TPA: F420-dependent NADP oxidoreductase [Bacteroidales bacterium]|nr:F420-dependent NADP oxidoreductase [Bacteroidales bacterium]HSA44193.1 F420-dependent NADP oxidoreductase [Bacteroidales bacterium]
MKPLKITIVGAGNVGTQLAQVFFSKGHQIVQICSKKPRQAQSLAKKVNAGSVSSISDLSKDADVYFLCIPDQAIRELSDSLQLMDKLVCHTSGSTEMEVLSAFSANFGVFYPLQTFSGRKTVNFRRVPICVEANNKQNEMLLFALGRQLSGDVRIIDSPRRMIIHLAAVIAGNFANYMYVIAEEILQKHGFSFSILHPLIEETSGKAVRISPYHAQTGPARRRDTEIIRRHLEMLKKEGNTRDIYDLVTSNIMKTFQ